MLGLTNSILLMTALFNAGLMVFILRGNWRSPINLLFGTFLAALSLWALALIGYDTAYSYPTALLLGKIIYTAGIIVAAGLFLFSYAFPEDTKPPGRVLLATCGVTLLFIVVLFEPSYLITSLSVGIEGKDPQLGLIEYLVFAALFLFFYAGGSVRLWRKYAAAKGLARAKLLFVVLAVTITGLGGLYYNIILPSPFFDDFRFIWTGPIFTTSIAVMITYSVFRFRLFNAKVIVTEFVVAVLWIFTLLRTLVASDEREQLFNAGLFALSLVIGILLARSVRQEVRAREEVQKLAQDLKMANERLKELDRLKSEFVSIASHQLRSPLTAIKGYASLILEGSFGSLSTSVKEAVTRIFESSQTMVTSVQDFLDVSRIEQGRMKYDMTDFDLAATLTSVIAEQRPNIEKKHLTVSYTKENGGSYLIHADEGKLKQVFTNLIDNSVKYTPQGTIAVAVGRGSRPNTLLVKVSDTGVGFSKETASRLFDKFIRADNAKEVNVMGTGLGLYVARQMVEAMKGRIWAESRGEGKGATFFVELPSGAH